MLTTYFKICGNCEILHIPLKMAGSDMNYIGFIYTYRSYYLP